jgi:cytidylate kinase
VVAEALGFTFVDREIALEAARRMGVEPEAVERLDERVPALVEQLGMTLAASAPPFGVVPPPIEAYALDDRALAEATRRVIVSLAEAGGYVILGRGGQAALAERPDACHLALVGDIRDRAQRVMMGQRLEEREARERCERVDSERRAYVRRFYGVDIRDPLLYDCVLNTTRLGVDAAAQLVIRVVRQKLGL